MQKSVFQMLLDVKTRGSNNIRRLGRDLQGVQGKAKNLASSFTGLTKPLIALAGISGGAALVTSIFGSRAELESQTRSLQVLTGSAEKTKQIVGEIKAFGAATPFQVRDLINVTKKLKAFGIETDSLVDTTKRLGDIAGATGADLDGIATAFGQIRAKGKFSQEENLQLLERGVDLTTELKKMYGLSGDELAKAMSKGQISFEAANQALITLTNQGGQYFGGAVAQADTLNGKLSTLQDAFVTLGQNIGKVLEPLFKGILDFVTFLTNKLNSLFEEADITNEALKNVIGGKTQAQFFKQRGAREILEAEKERIRGQRRSAAAETVQFTPALLAGTTPGGTGKTEAERAAEAGEKLAAKLGAQAVQQAQQAQARIEARRQENQFLELTLSKGKEFAEVTKEVTDLVQAGGISFNEAFDLVTANRNLREQVTTAEQLNQTFDNIKTTIKEGLVNGLTDAIVQGKSLASVMGGLLRQAASLFINFGLRSILPFAKGGVLQGGQVKPFAYGGVVNKPTLFPMANGMGLMGEAGPEGILPLRRGRSGRLGVEASGSGATTVNVSVDASGSSVQGDSAQASQLGKAIGVAVQTEILKQKRPGGLLATV